MRHEAHRERTIFMGVIKLKDNVYSVGVLNPCLRIFDVIMETQFGTSYNAYLLTGDKNVLIETVHATFFDEYIDNVRSVIALDKIDYIIMNHNEPDHSGSLKRLMALCPNAEILASQAGKIYLPQITNDPMPSLRAVKDGETLDLGGGRVLTFFHAPFLHWPDTMFTWSEQDKTAFTCDFLGAHYCEPTMTDARIPYQRCYERAFQEYYDAIMSPFKPYVLKGLDKLARIDPDIVCTSHGPVLHKGVFYEKAKERYLSWSTPDERTALSIPLFYVSAYGNTALLAHKIADGILSVLPDADVPVHNLNGDDGCSFVDEMNNADAFLLGSPTINKDALLPIWDLVNSVDAINSKGRPVAVFGSYGWSGEALPSLSARLEAMKLSVFEDGLRCRFVPSDDDLQQAFEFGARFAATLKQ